MKMPAWHEVIEPIDAVHYDSVAARAVINREFNALKAQVVTWRPAPMPADFERIDHVCRLRK
jgi:hypothetical protein